MRLYNDCSRALSLVSNVVARFTRLEQLLLPSHRSLCALLAYDALFWTLLCDPISLFSHASSTPYEAMHL
jgi:hypothetical protein